MTENQDDFLPADYEQPRSSNNYLKFETGDNRFRILSRPIMGWIDWKDGKPIRFRMNQKPLKPIDPAKEIKHFWAMAVYNRILSRVQILELDKPGVIASIKKLIDTPDWGSPFKYDLVVTKSGSGKSTSYVTNPIPPSPIGQEIMAELVQRPINLEALFTGEDPFASGGGSPAPAAPQQSQPAAPQNPAHQAPPLQQEAHAAISPSSSSPAPVDDLPF